MQLPSNLANFIPKTPWFRDGNLIVLTADLVAFRVHRCVLARQSEVFASMLSLPQPPTSQSELIDGCEVVWLQDPVSDLSNFLRAVYGNAELQYRSLEDFVLVSGILTLSTKYEANYVRKKSIQCLTGAWAHTLQGHDDMVEQTLTLPLAGGLAYPFVHPLHVIHVARRCHVRILLPSAFYFLSVYPFSKLVKLDHPKIREGQTLDSTFKITGLCNEDLINYNLMLQHRLENVLQISRTFCGKRKAESGCVKGGTICTAVFEKLSTILSRSWYINTGPIYWVLQAIREVDNNGDICRVCRDGFKRDAEARRLEMWESLPGVIGLPNWQVLIEEDLPRDRPESVEL